MTTMTIIKIVCFALAFVGWGISLIDGIINWQKEPTDIILIVLRSCMILFCITMIILTVFSVI